MEEYNFVDEIKKEFNVGELESATLKYRINGFIYACNMNLEDSICVKRISPTRLPYINKKKEEETSYDINFTLGRDREKGRSTILLGKYGDLNVYFVNYYDQDKRKDRVNEIPFQIVVAKMYHDYAYQIDIQTVSNSQVKFIIKKSKESEMLPGIVSFLANITDFSKVLKLVKSFVHNPELVFVAYDNVVNSKDIVFTTRDLNVALVKDEKLDKPTSKTGKILKKLLNND